MTKVPLNPQAKWLIENTPVARGAREIGRAREEFKTSAALLDAAYPPPLVRTDDGYAETRYGRIPVRRYHPADLQFRHPIVYFHGGGFVYGDRDTHHALVSRLAHTVGAVVVSVDYTRAPDAKFPRPVYEAFDAAEWTSGQAAGWGLSAGIVVSGDSSGGNFAAVVSQLARAAGSPAVLAQLLFYPSLNMASETASRREFGHGYFLEEEEMLWFGEQYLNNIEDTRNVLASPALSPDLKALPAAFVVTAEYDPLRDEGEAYAQALQQAGVAVKQVRYEGMIHGFMSMPLFAEAQAALDEAKAFLSALPN